MREGFTPAIKEINNAIKSDSDVSGTLLDFEDDLGGEISAEKIHILQQEKVQIMEELKAAMEQIDETGTVGVEGKMRSVTYDQESETMQYFVAAGETETLTKGQLLVAGIWEEEYFLSKDVPREVKKKYVFEKAKYRLAALYDHQIASSEANQSYNKNTGLDDAYTAVAERMEGVVEEPAGIIAERMVQSFLTRLMHDHNLPYSIKSANVQEDVEYKIDFLITPINTGETYGVGVEEPKPDIAIQFTTSKSSKTIAHKEKQIERASKTIAKEDSLHVRDLILVTLPIDQVQETYDTWNSTKRGKRIPGGPDQLWPEETQSEVFAGLLERVLPPGEADTEWQRVQSERITAVN